MRTKASFKSLIKPRKRCRLLPSLAPPILIVGGKILPENSLLVLGILSTMLRLRFEAYCRVCEPCAARKSLRTHSRPGNDCKKFPVIRSGDQACPGWVRVWGALWRSLGTPDQAGARPERGRRGSQRPSASPGGTATRRGGAQTSAWGAGSPPSTAPRLVLAPRRPPRPEAAGDQIARTRCWGTWAAKAAGWCWAPAGGGLRVWG